MKNGYYMEKAKCLFLNLEKMKSVFFENAMSSDTDLAKIQRKFINTLISLDEEEWIVLDRFMKKYHFNQK